jgi:hypothetical protein
MAEALIARIRQRKASCPRRGQFGGKMQELAGKVLMDEQDTHSLPQQKAR